MKTQERNKKYLFVRRPGKLNKYWNGIPATKRASLFEASLPESIFASIFCHAVVILLISLVSFALVFFGIAPKLFPPPKPKVNDVEFILKDHHPRKIKHLDIPMTAPVAKKETSSGPKSIAKKATQMPMPQMPKAKKPETHNIFSNLYKSPVKPAGKVSGKSSTVKSTGKSSAKQGNRSSSSGVKSHSGNAGGAGVPSFSMSKINSMSSGVGGGSGRSRHRASGFDASSASVGNASGASSGNGSGGRSGFDRTTTRKMILTFDISPYVSELKRNIRWNWTAPKSGGKRVDLFLRIAKDGRLVILNVKHSSENGAVDNAALGAVRKTAPLKPLPSKYAKGYLDVVCSFDSGSLSCRY